jgi:hypothetical protein
VGFRGPLQNHMVRTTVVPLRRIGIVGQLCSQLVSQLCFWKTVTDDRMKKMKIFH